MTLRSWLAGCLVLILAIFPHLLVLVALCVLMPETPNPLGAIVFAGGVLVVVFFARGGGVLLLRLLGVVRPAPPQVADMVGRLGQQMKVPGRIKVFELDWTGERGGVAFVPGRRFLEATASSHGRR